MYLWFKSRPETLYSRQRSGGVGGIYLGEQTIMQMQESFEGTYLGHTYRHINPAKASMFTHALYKQMHTVHLQTDAHTLHVGHVQTHTVINQQLLLCKLYL